MVVVEDPSNLSATETGHCQVVYYMHVLYM